MLINNVTYQRETLVERPIRLPLKHASVQGSVFRKKNSHHHILFFPRFLTKYGSSLQNDTNL